MMKSDITAIYRSAWAFALLCPLLFLVPVLVELAQHVAEWQAGMYDGAAGAKAAENDPLRLQFGFAKTLAIMLPGYWFVRFILFGGDADRARRIEWPAIGLWLIIFAIDSLEMWWTLFGPSLTGLMGLTGEVARWGGYTLAVGGFVLSLYLFAWSVAWSVGNARIGPIRSIAIMAGHFWCAFALLVAGVLPLMIVHYALVFAAVFSPAMLDWPLLLADSLVVGYLALTMAGAGTIAAKRAATAKGVGLLP